MNSLGIYFGPKFISIIESKGKKVLNKAQISQSAISAGDLEEKVPLEVKMVAVLKDALRRNKIEASQAVLCLSGKDLIIRTFGVPFLPKEELANAINFEAKKYMPFKIEEVISDFQVEPDRKNKLNYVLFAGIKKETFRKYASIFNQLNIKASAIQYSGFSLLSAFRLSGQSDRGIVAAMSVDLQEEDETNFMVLENGFPLFSRDISLSSIPEEAAKLASLEPTQYLDKLKTEIRVSLDYYNRKFPGKSIKKMVLICAQEIRAEIEAFLGELSIAPKFIDIVRVTGRQFAYSSGFIKGYSAALYKALRTRLKINLLSPAIKPVKQKAVSEFPSLLEGLEIDKRIVIAGLAICALTFVYGIYNLAPLQQELSRVVNARPQVPVVNSNANYQELTKISDGYKNKLYTLDNLVRKQVYLTPAFNAIAQSIPEGVWLTRLNFSKNSQDYVELTLDGSVYLVDSSEEFPAVNKFVNNLKENREFNRYFKDVNITVINLQQSANLTTTNFSLVCRYSQAKK